MPLYRITAPNGQTYQIEGPEGASDADVAQAVLAQFPEAGQAPRQSTIGSELVRGGRQLASSIRTGIEALGESPEAAAQRGVARGQAIGAEAGEGPSLEAVKRAYETKGILPAAGEALSQIPRALAGQGAQLGTMAAGARAGAALGALAPVPGGALIGGALGAGATLLPQFFGSNVERQAAEQMAKEEQVKIDRTKAGLAAAGQAAIEGAGTAFTLGKGVVKGILGIADDAALATAKAQQELVKTAQRSLAGTLGRGAARGATEMPVEVAQQILERAQAGLDLTSPEALAEYGESAYQAGLIGAPLGGAGNVVSRGQARTQVAAMEAQRRQEEAQRAAAEAEAAQVPKLPLVTAPGAQGELFGAETAPTPEAAQRDLFGNKVKAPEEPATIETAATPEGQADLGLDYQREVEQLYLERERLAQEGTPEADVRIAELTDQIRAYHEMDIAERQAQAQLDAETARQDRAAQKKFPALANAPELMAQSDEVKARTQGELFPGEDLGVAPTTEPVAEPKLRRAAEKAPRQIPLGLRRNPEGQPTTFGQPEPTFTAEDILMTAIPVRKGMEQWIEKNVLGSTRTQLLDLLKRQPELIQGNDQRAKLLRTLAVVDVPAFKEAPRDQTRTQKPAPEQRTEPRAGEPSVGVPVEPAATVVPEPRARVARPAGEPEAPVGLGLVPAGQPVGEGTQVEGKQPTAVTDLTQERAFRNALDQEGEALFAKLQSLADQGLATDADIANAQRIIQSAGSQQEAGFRLFKLLRQIEGAKRPIQEAAPAVAAPLQARLQAIIDDPSASKQSKQTAFAALDSLQDPELNETAEDRRQNEAYAEKALKEAEAQRNANVPVVGAESSQGLETGLAEAAKRGDARGALQAILQAPKELYNELDRAVARRLLLSNTLPTLKVVPRGTLGEQDGKVVGGVYNPYTDTVFLTDGYVGGHTLLHEMVHGFMHTAISLHETGERRSAGVRNLQDVYNHVAKANPALMSEYGMTNLSEFASEAMSNKAFQAELAKIPYRRENAFTEFARAVLRVLGLAPTDQHTALASAMISADSIMTSGRALQEASTGTQTSAKSAFAVAPGTEAIVASMGPLEPEQKSGLSKLITGFKSQTELPYAVKFRTQAADAAATVEHRLREQFDGAVRDSMGKFNPMGLYRQAQDHAKLLLEYFQVGALGKDPATNLWVVQTKPGVRPPAEVYAKIDAWGAKHGYDRERATQIASRVLEGVRLNELIKSNKDFPSHMKPAEIAQLVKEYNADPDLQEMSKLMDEARIAMVDNMVAVGRLSKEQGAEWKQVVGYVPFDRIEDFATNYSKVKKISNKGIAQIGKLPELIGSEKRPVGNVFDNYLNTLGWMVGQTMKTDATVQTLRSLENITTGPKAKFLHGSTQGKANTVGMYVGGEMKYWELPSKYDVMAFKDLNPPKANWLRMLGQFSNVLRTSVTALPPFALKQVSDDVQRAILTSGVKNPGALLRMAMTNFGGIAFAELRGIQHPSVREFGRLGLTGEYDFQAGKPATSLLKDLGYKKRGKTEALLHRLEGITRASDLAVRKAIYDQTLKETNDQLLAQTRAREFINFRRRGASDFVGAMVTTIPFFNAYIQGMDVLYRAASGKDSGSSVGRAQARKFFWSRAATVMMLSSLYALGKGDDEDYAEMDLRTRDNNWILGGGYKIPVPGELGALFKVIPERVVEYMRRQGTPEEQTAWEATRTALTYVFEQYVGRVTPVPQAVKPLLEAFTNHSFFTGRELEGIYQKQQDPSMRRASNTSELAIAIAAFARDMIGVDAVSPILVDNALNGYFGSSAALLVATTDSLLNPTRVDRPLHKWALVSNYMYDPVGTRRMTEFYEARETVGRANTTLNELLKTDMDRAAKYAEEHADELMLESAVNSTLEQLERTRAYRKFLNSPDAADSMPKAEREAELQELRKMEVELTSWLREAKASMR